MNNTFAAGTKNIKNLETYLVVVFYVLQVCRSELEFFGQIIYLHFQFINLCLWTARYRLFLLLQLSWIKQKKIVSHDQSQSMNITVMSRRGNSSTLIEFKIV